MVSLFCIEGSESICVGLKPDASLFRQYIIVRREMNIRQQSTRSMTAIMQSSTMDVRLPSTSENLSALYNNTRLSQADVRPSQAFTSISQARQVPQWRTDYKSNDNAKYSAQTVPDFSQKPPGEQIAFDYQREYEKLLTKYRKKEEKYKKQIKDLSNQIIVKDSIISNFQIQISSCRPTNQDSLLENEDLKKSLVEVKAQLNTVCLKNEGLLHEKVKIQSQLQLNIASLQKDLATSKKRIEDLERSHSLTASSSQNLSRDRDQIIMKVADMDRQLKVKDSRIGELEAEVRMLGGQVNDLKREIEMSSRGLTSKLEETKTMSEKQLQMRNLKIKELEADMIKRLSEIGELRKKADTIPSQISSKVEECRSEYEKKLQQKDSKINQAEGERLRAQRNVQEMKLQIDSLTNQLNHSKQELEQVLKTKQAKIGKLETDLKDQLKRIHQGHITQVNTKRQLESILQQRDAHIAELESNLSKVSWELGEAKKQTQLYSMHYKSKQEQLNQKTTVEVTMRQERIEQLSRELTEVRSRHQKQVQETKSRYDSLIIQQNKRLEETQIQYARSTDQTRNSHLEQLHKHQTEIAQLQKQLRQTQQNSEGNCLKLQYRVQQAQKLVKVKEDSIAKLELQVNGLSKYSEEVKTSSDAQLGVYLKNITDQQKQLDKRQLQIITLQKQLRGVSATVGRLQQQLKQLGAAFDDQKQRSAREKQGLCRQLLQLQNTKKEHESANRETQFKIHQLENVLLLKDRSIADLSKQIQTKAKYYESLNQSHTSKYQDVRKAYQDMKSKYDATFEQLNLTKNKLDIAETESKSSKDQNGLLKKLLKDKDSQISNLSSRTLDSSREILQYKQNIQQLNHQLFTQRSELQRITRQLTSLKQSSESKISSLVNSLYKAQNQVSSMSASNKTQIYQLQNTLKTQSNRIAQLQLEVQQLKQNQSQLQLRIQHVQTELNNHREYSTNLRKDLVGQLQSTQKQNIDKILTLQQQIQALNNSLQEQENEMRGMGQMLAERERELDVRSLKGVQLEEEVVELRKNILGLNISSIQATKAAESLSRKLEKDRYDALQQVASLKQKLQDTQAISAYRQSQLKSKQSEVAALEDKLRASQALNSRIRELEIEAEQMKRTQQLYQNESLEASQLAEAHRQEIEQKQRNWREVEERLYNQITVLQEGARNRELQLLNQINILKDGSKGKEGQVGDLAKKIQVLQLTIKQKEFERDVSDRNIHQLQAELQQLSQDLTSQKELNIRQAEKYKMDLSEITKMAEEKIHSITREFLEREQQTSPVKAENNEMKEYLESVIAEQEGRMAEMCSELQELRVLYNGLLMEVEKARLTIKEQQIRLEMLPTAASPPRGQRSLDQKLFENKYHNVLTLLQLSPQESDENVKHKVELLISIHQRYDKSMKDLMEKIEWMEQNLNILNQENTDYHTEIEAKENAIAELKKEVELKDKLAGEVRMYENHSSILVKRLSKIEELLEEANKTILSLQVRQLNYQMERLQREEQPTE